MPPGKGPDGLQVGVVGPVGAQGQVGAAIFAAGSNNSTGVWPCSSAGCGTSVSSSTTWGNVAITLHGNVTVGAGQSLTVWDSTLTFVEPATTTGTAYGFNLTAAGSSLLVLHGSNVTQSSANANSWFVYTNSTGPSITWWNSTVDSPSTHPVVGSTGRAASMRGLWVSTFAYSTYFGHGYYGIQGSLNVTRVATHSLVSHGTFNGIDGGNDTFDTSQVGINGGPLAFGNGGTFSLNWSTVLNLGGSATLYTITAPGLGINTGGQPFANLGTDQEYIVHSKFVGWNLSYATNAWRAAYRNPSYYGAANDVKNYYRIDNTSVSNVWTYNLAGTPILAGDDNGGSYQAAIDLPRGLVSHNTLRNVSLYGSFAAPAGLNLVQSTGYVNVLENLVDGWYTRTLYTESSPFVVLGFSYNFSYNVFRNFVASPIFSPLSTNQVFNVQDQHNQIYNELVGFENPVMQLSCINSQSCGPNYTGPYHAAHNAVGNWLVNSTGQNWLMQLIGGNASAIGNTIENLTSAGGLGVSVNSRSIGAWISANVCYGVYNYSYCVGSNEGGAVGTVYQANSAADVDSTSWDSFESESNETWSRTPTGTALYLLNTNGTNGIGNGKYRYHTSKVYLQNATVSTLQVLGLVVGTNATTRTPLPNDFNVTVANSYVPGSLTGLARSFSQRTGATAYLNPSFLNLSGFLGVFPGQFYAINTSQVRGETSLTVNAGGQTAAVFPITGTRHFYGFEVVAPGSYIVAADSSSAPAVDLAFSGLVPGASYTLLVTNGTTGAVLGNGTSASSASGTLTAVFDPAAGRLNLTYTLSCVAACSGGSAPGLFDQTFLGLPVTLWLVLAAGASLIGVAAAARRSSP